MKAFTALVTAIFLFVAGASSVWSAERPVAVPQEVLDRWDYLMGEWKIEGTVGGRPVAGRASFRWAPGNHCYIVGEQWRLGEAGNLVHLTRIGGWDDSNRQMVEHGFDSVGGTGSLRYEEISASSNADTITAKASGWSRGQRWTADVQIQRADQDQWTLTSRTPDGTPLHVLNYRRVKPPAER